MLQKYKHLEEENAAVFYYYLILCSSGPLSNGYLFTYYRIWIIILYTYCLQLHIGFLKKEKQYWLIEILALKSLKSKEAAGIQRWEQEPSMLYGLPFLQRRCQLSLCSDLFVISNDFCLLNVGCIVNEDCRIVFLQLNLICKPLNEGVYTSKVKCQQTFVFYPGLITTSKLQLWDVSETLFSFFIFLCIF